MLTDLTPEISVCLPDRPQSLVDIIFSRFLCVLFCVRVYACVLLTANLHVGVTKTFVVSYKPFAPIIHLNFQPSIISHAVRVPPIDNCSGQFVTDIYLPDPLL